METKVRDLQILALLLFTAVVTGLGSWWAWFRPKEFQKLLDTFAQIYRGWLPIGERTMKSKLNFHILRIGGTVLFFVSIAMIAYNVFLR